MVSGSPSATLENTSRRLLDIQADTRKGELDRDKAFRATDVTFCQFGYGGLQSGLGLMDSLCPSTCHTCAMPGPAPRAGHRVIIQAFLKELSFE